MAGKQNSLIWSQADATAETSVESRHFVPETSPQDNVKRISGHLTRCEGQSRQSEASSECAETESDSGNSLFITQEPAALSRRRKPFSLRSSLPSHRDGDENESDSSSSASHEESKRNKYGRKKKYTLPKYSFQFLVERKRKSTSNTLPVRQSKDLHVKTTNRLNRKQKSASNKLLVRQNKGLHNAAMGGFFQHVREKQQICDDESSLPTVYIDWEYISPLSEEEEGDRLEDEDIKVVGKKCFLAPSKANSLKTWCNQLKQQRTSKADHARHETPTGTQRKRLHETTPNTPMSWASPLPMAIESADDGESSSTVLRGREMNDNHVTSDRNSLTHQETPKTKRRLSRGHKKFHFQQEDNEDELCSDSDATVCELPVLQRSTRQDTLEGRDAFSTATEPQIDVSHTDDLSHAGQTEDELESQSLLQSLPHHNGDANNVRVYRETRTKNRTQNEGDHGVEEESDHSQGELEGLHAARPVNVDVGETPRLSEDNGAEPAASYVSDELELTERNCMDDWSHTTVRQEERDIPKSKQKKRKRKNSAAGSITQEVVGSLESSGRMEEHSVNCNVENGGKREKKKKNRKTADEQLRSSTAAEPLNGLEDTAACEEILAFSSIKRKKHKNKQQLLSDDEEEGVNVGSNDAVTLDESTGAPLKKKKKKKKKTLCVGVDVSDDPDNQENEKREDGEKTQETKEGLEDQNGELVTEKKKKKNKKSKNSCGDSSKDTVAQSDDSVSVRKKGKKWTSSFLVADVEEKDAQTHGEQNSPSPAVEASVWSAEKPAVSTVDFETESAENTGNMKEFNDRRRKKKRKRKMSEEHESVGKNDKQDYETPESTFLGASSETTDTGGKRKKEQRGNGSESMTPVEKSESAAAAEHSPTDEAVVWKKKKRKGEPLHVIEESSAAAADESESVKSTVNTSSLASPKKKGKHGHRADISHDSSTSDQATKETRVMVGKTSPSSKTPTIQAVNCRRDKENKIKLKSPDNYLLEGTESADLEPQEVKKKKKKQNVQSNVLSITSSSPMLSDVSLLKREMSNSIVGEKHKKVKRRLHDPNNDFLIDS